MAFHKITKIKLIKIEETNNESFSKLHEVQIIKIIIKYFHTFERRMLKTGK